jgi:cyclase
LVKESGLVKTVQFQSPKYVGDPINAVRIFNEKEVYELVVLSIDRTARAMEPDFGMISNLAAECRMPLCYGGGVKTPEQVQRIVALGVEKVAISSAAIADPSLIERSARQVGSQSVVVVLDVRKANGGWEVFTHNGSRATGSSVEDLVRMAQSSGAGEIVINSIDRDGAMKGYDEDLAARVRAITNTPLTILGGAGSLADIQALIRKMGVIGAAAGSLFVFKGVYRAVLINYPTREAKRTILGPS